MRKLSIFPIIPPTPRHYDSVLRHSCTSLAPPWPHWRPGRVLHGAPALADYTAPANEMLWNHSPNDWNWWSWSFKFSTANTILQNPSNQPILSCFCWKSKPLCAWAILNLVHICPLQSPLTTPPPNHPRASWNFSTNQGAVPVVPERLAVVPRALALMAPAAAAVPVMMMTPPAPARPTPNRNTAN